MINRVSRGPVLKKTIRGHIEICFPIYHLSELIIFMYCQYSSSSWNWKQFYLQFCHHSWRFFGRKCFYFLYHGASSECPLCSTSEYFPSPAGTAPLILLVPLVSVSYCAGRNSFRISSTSEVVRTLSAQFLSSELDSLLKFQEAASALVEKLCVLSYSQAM